MGRKNRGRKTTMTTKPKPKTPQPPKTPAKRARKGCMSKADVELAKGVPRITVFENLGCSKVLAAIMNTFTMPPEAVYKRHLGKRVQYWLVQFAIAKKKRVVRDTLGGLDEQEHISRPENQFFLFEYVLAALIKALPLGESSPAESVLRSVAGMLWKRVENGMTIERGPFIKAQSTVDAALNEAHPGYKYKPSPPNPSPNSSVIRAKEEYVHGMLMTDGDSNLNREVGLKKTTARARTKKDGVSLSTAPAKKQGAVSSSGRAPQRSKADSGSQTELLLAGPSTPYMPVESRLALARAPSYPNIAPAPIYPIPWERWLDMQAMGPSQFCETGLNPMLSLPTFPETWCMDGYSRLQPNPVTSSAAYGPPQQHCDVGASPIVIPTLPSITPLVTKRSYHALQHKAVGIGNIIPRRYTPLSAASALPECLPHEPPRKRSRRDPSSPKATDMIIRTSTLRPRLSDKPTVGGIHKRKERGKARGKVQSERWAPSTSLSNAPDVPSRVLSNPRIDDTVPLAFISSAASQSSAWTGSGIVEGQLEQIAVDGRDRDARRSPSLLGTPFDSAPLTCG